MMSWDQNIQTLEGDEPRVRDAADVELGDN